MIRDKKPIRLRTMGEGALFGEIALSLNIPRSLMIVATKPGTLYKVAAKALGEMEKRSPDLTIESQ